MVNRGIAVAGLSDDFDNDVRPHGGGFDLGADEYVEPDITVDLIINSNHFTGGDRFNLTCQIANRSGTATVCHYVILDVASQYWFWPDWSRSVDYRQITIEGITDPIFDILAFTWPENAGTASGIRFWSGCMNGSNTELTGNVDFCEFSFSDDG